MIHVFADRHMSEQPCARQTAFDWLGQARCRGDMRLTVLAGIFEPDVLDNMEARGLVVELLTGFLADFLALFPTAGTSTRLFIENVDLRYPRQVRRQFFATTGASRRRAIRRLGGHR